MKVADLMATEVATCSATDNLNRAAQIMWERRCGSVPVVDQGEHVLGMVTDRDVCMAAYTQGRRLDDIPVISVMSHPARTCPGAATAEQAESLMMAHGVHRLVVVDDDGCLSGVLSLDDIARHGASWDGHGGIDLERVAVTLGEIAHRTGTSEDVVPDDARTDLSDLVANSLEVLGTLREEIRTDLKLASQDTRRRWARLEARLHAAEIRVQDRGRGSARHLAALVTSARRFGGRLKHPRTSTGTN